MELRYADKQFCLELIIQDSGLASWVKVLEEIKEDLYRLEGLEK